MFAIRQARPDDLTGVQSLLKNCELPYEDISNEHLADFIVLGQSDPLVGCVGIERFGPDALLRSLAIDPLRRSGGFGRALLNVAEIHAQEAGIVTLYLLTTSAADFFEENGYQRVDRTEVPAPLQSSTQFSSLCPSGSTCLFKSVA